MLRLVGVKEPNGKRKIYVYDLPPPLHQLVRLVRELLSQTYERTIVGLVDVGSMKRAARRSVVLADAVPVRGAAADSVVEGVDS